MISLNMLLIVFLMVSEAQNNFPKILIHPTDRFNGINSDHKLTANTTCEYDLSINEDSVLTEISTIQQITIKVFLEGSHITGQTTMATGLNTGRSILPGQTPVNALATPTPPGNPYRGSPWNYNGFITEETFAGPYDDGQGLHVVDWILVSFRTSPSKISEVDQANGLLYEDGTVQFIRQDILDTVSANDLWVVIEHRNHMAVMSDTAVTIQGNALTYDFTITNSFRSPTNFGQKQIEPGVFVMYAGDADQQSDFPSYDINGLDNITWTLQNGGFDAYLLGDFNLNGDVNGADIILWNKNNGISSSVPKN